MPSDRFVYFTKERAPAPAQVLILMEDFFGAAAVMRDNGDRLLAKLPGERPTSPFRRLEPRGRGNEARHDGIEGRYVEVFVASLLDDVPRLNVMTRSADALTSVLADRLAELLAEYWEGTREE